MNEEPFMGSFFYVQNTLTILTFFDIYKLEK